jgi:hypothetical protein
VYLTIVCRITADRGVRQVLVAPLTSKLNNVTALESQSAAEIFSQGYFRTIIGVSGTIQIKWPAVARRRKRRGGTRSLGILGAKVGVTALRASCFELYPENLIART